MRTNDRVAAVGVGDSQTGRRSGLSSWQLGCRRARRRWPTGASPRRISTGSVLWGVAGPEPAGLDRVEPRTSGTRSGSIPSTGSGPPPRPGLRRRRLRGHSRYPGRICPHGLGGADHQAAHELGTRSGLRPRAVRPWRRATRSTRRRSAHGHPSSRSRRSRRNGTWTGSAPPRSSSARTSSPSATTRPSTTTRSSGTRSPWTTTWRRATSPSRCSSSTATTPSTPRRR